MVYIISYDLNKPGQDYNKLYDRIRTLNDYYHVLDSTWLVSTNKTAKEVYSVLQPVGDTNDNILVIQVTSNYWGWLPQKAWEWLSSKF
ncbi:hypothetical protein [Clostridium intestinale]|uniref:SinR-like protein n=1 Tax=Clostridium intestinale URNW TaxID=1294142 RepID=U2PYL5_9CLOT|nr:hypothetical protein [Clostridium intestinale]ERK31565.1 SinR-like protein [Clostridium intestinale URNW]